MPNRFQISHKFILTFIVTGLVLGCLGLFPSFRPAYAATDYYLDCSAGSDGSGSQSSPWNNLTSANNKVGGFSPGDRLLLKRGTACSGRLNPTGSGASGAPVTLDAYGDGSRPIINAGGAYESAILLTNLQYWTVQNLEITNNAGSEAQHEKEIEQLHAQIARLSMKLVWLKKMCKYGITFDQSE